MELKEIFMVLEIIALMQREKFFITLDDILSDEEKENITNLLVKNLSVNFKMNFEGDDIECDIYDSYFHNYLCIAREETREIIHRLDLGKYLLHHVDELKSLKNFLISEKYNQEIIDKLIKLIKLLEEKE